MAFRRALFSIVLPNELLIGSLIKELRAFSVTHAGKSTIGTTHKIAVFIHEFARYVATLWWDVIDHVPQVVIPPYAGWRIRNWFCHNLFDFILNAGRCIVWNIGNGILMRRMWVVRWVMRIWWRFMAACE